MSISLSNRQRQIDDPDSWFWKLQTTIVRNRAFVVAHNEALMASETPNRAEVRRRNRRDAKVARALQLSTRRGATNGDNDAVC